MSHSPGEHRSRLPHARPRHPSPADGQTAGAVGVSVWGFAEAGLIVLAALQVINLRLGDRVILAIKELIQIRWRQTHCFGTPTKHCPERGASVHTGQNVRNIKLDYDLSPMLDFVISGLESIEFTFGISDGLYVTVEVGQVCP